jgi:hypothetical protein
MEPRLAVIKAGLEPWFPGLGSKSRGSIGEVDPSSRPQRAEAKPVGFSGSGCAQAVGPDITCKHDAPNRRLGRREMRDSNGLMLTAAATSSPSFAACHRFLFCFCPTALRQQLSSSASPSTCRNPSLRREATPSLPNPTIPSRRVPFLRVCRLPENERILNHNVRLNW